MRVLPARLRPSNAYATVTNWNTFNQYRYGQWRNHQQSGARAGDRPVEVPAATGGTTGSLARSGCGRHLGATGTLEDFASPFGPRGAVP